MNPCLVGREQLARVRGGQWQKAAVKTLRDEAVQAVEEHWTTMPHYGTFSYQQWEVERLRLEARQRTLDEAVYGSMSWAERIWHHVWDLH